MSSAGPRHSRGAPIQAGGHLPGAGAPRRQYRLGGAADVKSGSQAAPIPIILFSWLEDEEKARAAGAAVYVRKPVMYVDFLDALAAAGFRRENQE